MLWKRVAEHILRGGQAMVVELPPGMRIRIVDTVGGQLGAMMAFAKADPNRGFSIAASLALSALNRSLGSDTSVALIEDDVVAHQGGEKLLRGQPARSMRSTCLARRRTCRSTA